MKIIKTLFRTEIEINTEDIKMLRDFVDFGVETKTFYCGDLLEYIRTLFNLK